MQRQQCPLKMKENQLSSETFKPKNVKFRAKMFKTKTHQYTFVPKNVLKN